MGIVLGLVAAGIIGSSIGNGMRESKMRSFYEKAREIKTEYFKGNSQYAREEYEDLWRDINQTIRDDLKDPVGQLRKEDVSKLETELCWESLTSTNTSRKK